MKREYPKHPLLGVGAVVFMDQEVVLVRRGQHPGKGQWSLPGGVVELGEPILDALERELWEEVSVKIEIGGLIGVFDRIIRDLENRVKYHYVLVDYYGSVVLGDPRPASDVTEVRMVPLTEISDADMDMELKQTILKAVAMRDSALRAG
jgi:ADP-ribose pyrophosphatase YjhB (NUDIX family)